MPVFFVKSFRHPGYCEVWLNNLLASGYESVIVTSSVAVRGESSYGYTSFIVFVSAFKKKEKPQ